LSTKILDERPAVNGACISHLAWVYYQLYTGLVALIMIFCFIKCVFVFVVYAVWDSTKERRICPVDSAEVQRIAD